MKLDVTQGIQRKGIDVPFTLEESWPDDRWGGDIVRFAGPVVLSGVYMITGDTVVVNGRAQAAVESRCARCLAPAVTQVDCEVSEAFVRRTEENDSAADWEQYTYEGHVLDLTEAVRSAVLLEVPTRVLCNENCRGLCPVCGTNLNVSMCSCQKEPVRSNPFSALASLFESDGLEEDGSGEDPHMLSEDEEV